MRFTRLFNRPQESSLPLFDEAFLRRLERLSFRTVPSLRGAMLGERRSRNLRPALDFSDHRPYTTGDDLRHIDWNAYARHEELFVKLGEATQSVNVHILLDCSHSMAWTPTHQAAVLGQVSKWDAARRLAGAMAYLGLASGERVKITPFVHQLGQGFGPTEGKRRIIAVLKFLSALHYGNNESRGARLAGPAPQPSALSPQLLDSYARNHPSGGLLVLISDLFDTGAGDLVGLSDGLRHLATPRWQVLVLHLLTQEEIQPTLEGDLDLQDSETSESLPFHFDDHTLAQYRLRVRAWCAELQSACAGRGATYARILAEWPLEKAVIPFLRQRGVIQ
jgi:uncharacterized protein (DUF58 family)